MIQVNQNNPIEVKNAGFAVLNDALGPVCAVRFMQQFSLGTGDYTKEKYKNEDISPEDAEALMVTFSRIYQRIILAPPGCSGGVFLALFVAIPKYLWYVYTATENNEVRVWSSIKKRGCLFGYGYGIFKDKWSLRDWRRRCGNGTRS